MEMTQIYKQIKKFQSQISQLKDNIIHKISIPKYLIAAVIKTLKKPRLELAFCPKMAPHGHVICEKGRIIATKLILLWKNHPSEMCLYFNEDYSLRVCTTSPL